LGVIFGLASALSWGAGDFCGGLVSRYSSVFAAVLTSQGIGLAASLVILASSGEAAPGPESLIWASFAGIAGVGGLGFFYLALARGTMGVVAPLAAVIGAGLPVLVAVIGGEETPILRIAGIAMALVAVVLISVPGRASGEVERKARRVDIAELPIVVLAGLGFAGFFIGLDRASTPGVTWWPLTFVRVAGFSLVFGAILVAIARRPDGALRRRAAAVLGVDQFRASGRGVPFMVPLFVLTGLGDLGGNTFFVLARNADAFAVAVVLASLYPIVTTVLAALLLKERLRPAQIAGVVLATLSVPLLR
jgi:drug/metabolite transporter (DMT)-like permease